jgi:hypothetical protein
MTQIIHRILVLGLLILSSAFLAGYAIGAVGTIAHTLEVLVR